VACATAEDLCLILQAREAADELVERCLHVPVRKAMNLGSARGFDRAVGKLAALLRARASDADDAAVRAAVGILDVDWAATTASQRRTLIGRALEAAGRKTAAVPRAVQAVFGDAATEVVQATRDAARRGQGLAIAADFNALDKRIVRHLTSSQANFVRDEYGRRHDVFGQRARQIVAEGLKAGLGREDIGRDLERAAREVIAGRGSFYWEVVAGSFVSRGRSFAQLSAYAEAGIDRYIIEAVLDERTTEICRFLHGKTFSVSQGLSTFEQVEQNPDAVKELTPWVRDGVDAKGRQVMFVDRGGGRTRRVAVVDRPGFGTRDARGSYSAGLSTARLQEIGVSFPPYHGLCRTTTVADVSARVVTPRVAEAVPEPRSRRDGPAELLAASKRFASSSGEALPLDSGFIENFDVQFRLEQIGGNDVTKVRFKVTDQHAERVRAAILRGERVQRSDTYRHLKGRRDPKTGRIVKGSEQGSLRFRAVSSSFGKVRVRMVTEKGALTNFVEMDIPTANATEAFKAYGEAAKRLGIADATSFPSAESLDVLRKARLITQYDRAGWEKLRRLEDLSPETVDPIFREAQKRFPELGQVLEDTKLVQTAPGHVSLYSKAQATRLKKDGVVGLIHDLSDPDALVHILGDPDGSGLLSSTQRYGRGLFVNGMSTGTDFGTGGADGVFTRVVARGRRHLGLHSHGARVLIDADQVGRSDWYFFNFDNFGRAGPAQFRERKLVPEIRGTLPRLASSNEMVFQHGIPVDALRGVVIPNAQARRRIIQKLRDAGITEVNGKPIEKFIMSRERF